MPITVFVLACIEIACLIKVGQAIGGRPVLGIILLTGVLGLALLQWTGRSAAIKLTTNLFVGKLSARDLLRREISLLVAGILLLIPGLLSDVAGLVLLSRYLFTQSSPQRFGGTTSDSDRDVIDVEYHVDNKDPRE